MSESKGRILVVDDSVATRAFVRSLLESNGFEVEEAKSGFDALRILPRADVDAAIIDINMPDLHGLELVRHIRSRDNLRDLGIVIISSESSTRDVARGRAAGADAYLPKPFEAAELLATLETLIDEAE